MAQAEQLSLCWDSHQKSICNGLSQLQQRGEFVDMTLAADGYHVKVHQMVLSLVSPYIKDLISTANCPHPVVFLNNISYTTLRVILEYIYTGEALVPKHQLHDVIAAGKALHIRGLKEMVDEKTAESGPIKIPNPSPPKMESISERLRFLKEKKNPTQSFKDVKLKSDVPPAPICKIYLDEKTGNTDMDIQDSPIDIHDDSNDAGDTTLDITDTRTPNSSNNGQSDTRRDPTAEDTKKILLNSKVQYSVSNQGGLQTIYNRYIYQLRYINKDRKISWRCIYYNKTRCPAHIFTNDDDQVVDRTHKHNHPFHDMNILRKYRCHAVHTSFQEASLKSKSKKDKITNQKSEMVTIETADNE